MSDCIPTLPKYSLQSAVWYVTYLSNKGYKYSTIKGTLTGISYYYKFNIGRDPFSSFTIQKLLDGHQKLEHNELQKAPFTMDLVVKLVDSVRYYTMQPYLRLLLKALMLMLYHCCMRIGEAVLSHNPNHVLKRHQVVNVNTGTGDTFQITFKTYKFSRKQAVLQMKRSLNATYCAVSALESYIKVRIGDPTGYLFTNEDGSAVTRSQFDLHLHNIVELSGLDPSRYSTHSFRTGRTTDLAAGKASDRIVQATGRWNSSAYKKYIRPSYFQLPQ